MNKVDVPIGVGTRPNPHKYDVQLELGRVPSLLVPSLCPNSMFLSQHYKLQKSPLFIGVLPRVISAPGGASRVPTQASHLSHLSHLAKKTIPPPLLSEIQIFQEMDMTYFGRAAGAKILSFLDPVLSILQGENAILGVILERFWDWWRGLQTIM